VLLFLLFSLLSMGQIAFVAHIVSLFLAPLIVWQDHLIHGRASARFNEK
jgi:hypothetical protein